MKRIVFVLGVTIGLLTFAGVSWAATSVDALIEKLVDKGVLSRIEGIQLKAEIAEDEHLVRKEGLKADLPQWLQNMKLKGDLRLRYQYERDDNDADARERGRVRYRLGLETKIADNVKVGAGLASGGDDPRSTNQTFDDTFETGDIRLDYAYAEYTPIENVKLVGGKFPFKNYLWTPTDLLWDGDVNPAGGAIHAEHALLDNVTGFLNTGVWVIDEHNKTDMMGRFLNYAQGGLKVKEGSVDAAAAATYYGFHGVKGTCPDWSAGTNTGITSTGSGGSCTGALMYDYDSVGTSAEVGVAKLFGGLPFGIDERISAFGDFIHNVDPDDNNVGWAAGIKFGNKKVTKGNWQAKWLYAYLEKDAWLDALPDSDRLGGRTDVQGHEASFSYGLLDNVTLGLDYYQTKRIVATAENVEHLIQGDVVLKF